jgi:hypothetical protein
MARSSLRNRIIAGLTSAIVVALSVAASAHRRDEYLQAARIAIDPDRVQVELDLTAGMSVADAIIRDIDRDGSGSIAGGEARAYAAAAVRAIRLEIDRVPLQMELLNVTVPDLDDIRNGEGAIRVGLSARLPGLAAGPHQIFFLNAHRSDIGVYLANAVMPASPRIEVTAQRRDVAQREITVDFLLAANSPTGARMLLPLGVLVVLSLAAFGWMREGGRTGSGSLR